MLASRMLSKDEEGDAATDTEVTREDQEKINTFSKLHSREKALEEKLSAKQKDKEDLEEVSTELELADEDDFVPYKIGESFMSVPLAEAQSMLAAATAEIDAEVTALEDAQATLREEMDALKAQLYARFGRSINLEA